MPLRLRNIDIKSCFVKCLERLDVGKRWKELPLNELDLRPRQQKVLNSPENITSLFQTSALLKGTQTS